MYTKLELLDYSVAKPLIQEADLLLFRGTSLVSWFIGKATESRYSHVGMASWVNGNTDPGAVLECIEFREGGGGRAMNLERVVRRYPETIDVYRPIPVWASWEFDPVTHETKLVEKEFDGKAVTRTMRKLTGLPYGWRRMWWIAKHKMVGLRFLYNQDDLMIDDVEDVVYPVCSTAAAYAYNKNGYDLMHNRSDQWTQPSDIAMSTRLAGLFTLTIER